MKWGSITPTDVDMSIDFGGKLFVFVEYKHGDAPFPEGQKKHLEYLVKSILAGKAHAVAAIARHSQSIGEDIACKDAIVDKIFCAAPNEENGAPEWRDRSSKNVSVVNWIDSVVAYYGVFGKATVETFAVKERSMEEQFLEENGYPIDWVTSKSELERK